MHARHESARDLWLLGIGAALASKPTREQLIEIGYAPHELDGILLGFARSDAEAVWEFLESKGVSRGEKAVESVLERLRGLAEVAKGRHLSSQVRAAWSMADRALAMEKMEELNKMLEDMGEPSDRPPVVAARPG